MTSLEMKLGNVKFVIYRHSFTVDTFHQLHWVTSLFDLSLVLDQTLAQ